MCGRRSTPRPLKFWSVSCAKKSSAPITMIQAVLPIMRKQKDGRIINDRRPGGAAPASGPFSVRRHQWRTDGADQSDRRRSGARQHPRQRGVPAIYRVRPADRRHQWRDERSTISIARQRPPASPARYPLGRTGTSEEVADLTAFIASDRANFITGSVGQHRRRLPPLRVRVRNGHGSRIERQSRARHRRQQRHRARHRAEARRRGLQGRHCGPRTRQARRGGKVDPRRQGLLRRDRQPGRRSPNWSTTSSRRSAASISSSAMPARTCRAGWKMSRPTRSHNNCRPK